MSATARATLSVALEHYDRFVPLFDGSVVPRNFDVELLQVGQSHALRHGEDRHERMLNRNEFDIAELSLASYLIARDRGLPFIAIPYFPRRLFSQSQIWINTVRGVRDPIDLIGKKVGLNTFQTTLSVLAKGDLQAEYGVPWRALEWYISKDETLPLEPQAGVIVRKLPDGADLGGLLNAGELDAVFTPAPTRALLESPNVRRLFADSKAEEARYYRKNGFFPIMHVIALQQRIAVAHPELVHELYELLLTVDRVAEHFYDDPAWSRLAWGRLDLEEERRLLGPDIWPAGFARNRANLERFIGYAHDQGLIAQPMSAESLFLADYLGT